jgi:broad specificity phosphatase PhoE
METFENAAERGYQGLSWLLNNRKEERILLVCHGGILRYTMNIHPLVHLQDERSEEKRQNGKSVESRFDNCEVRKYRLSWKDQDACQNSNDEGNNEEVGQDEVSRRPILLAQIDH